MGPVGQNSIEKKDLILVATLSTNSVVNVKRTSLLICNTSVSSKFGHLYMSSRFVGQNTKQRRGTLSKFFMLREKISFKFFLHFFLMKKVPSSCRERAIRAADVDAVLTAGNVTQNVGAAQKIDSR